MKRVIDQCMEDHHHEHPHQGKGNVILFPTHKDSSNRARAGPVSCRCRLGGLLKLYNRVAA